MSGIQITHGTVIIQITPAVDEVVLETSVDETTTTRLLNVRYDKNDLRRAVAMLEDCIDSDSYIVEDGGTP